MQSIMRIAMALVIAFGVETTASAQFGGLNLPKKRRKLSKRWRRPSRMSTTPRTK